MARGGLRARAVKVTFLCVFLWFIYSQAHSKHSVVDGVLLFLQGGLRRTDDGGLSAQIGPEPVLHAPADGPPELYMEYNESTGGVMRKQFESLLSKSILRHGLESTSALDRSLERNNYIVDTASRVDLIDSSQPSGSITLVSGLWDLGRGELSESRKRSSDFHRDFKEYTDGLKATFLANPGYKVLFLDSKLEAELRPYVRDPKNNVKNLKLVVIDIPQIVAWFGAETYAQKDAIRTDPEWSDVYGPTGWLALSPQAKLKDYNTIVMYKINLLRMAARANPWNTEAFLFIDSRHACHDPGYFVDENMGFLRQNMDSMLVTHFNYKAIKETHGFKAGHFMEWLGLPERSTHKVVRGGIFGGKRSSIEAVAVVYENILRQTLADGVMGTEENLFSIILYRHPALMHGFNNDNACYESVNHDHSCEGFVNRANFCSIFDFVNSGVIHRDGTTRTRVYKN
ncbi:hypothetical protein SARC_05221 [Sphaeroforma arctica JP610]|uniref:Nucleotide-diphospho-sugar transferase domain-containing protein n=1 Tax=Sphaeroforma arctica JP610 TaxID=667725 RepID=A0A0L0G099_9EUKA|nr:hypothetical protein SARC_05221 [Sphaeroforma arctica JP610]KNC82495.1 hypothetical protein SARC_05221 [Sphaeroforma arctica JP610]|eukprot:XP_014156397.1 hypothetical protein SARC_05221 [Sphaeroforma arctica JP610]